MRLNLAVAALLLAGCAARPPAIDTAGADAVLLGEQHDADSHRDLQEQWVATLARRGALGALLLEMAERGHSTRGLQANASEREVKTALAWNEEAWPWDRYRPAVMAAVRAGVPVLGANLPRGEMRQAMGEPKFDMLLAGPALKAQQQAIRQGHCGMLPETQVRPMTRVQVARDVAMAQTIAAAAAKGKTVVLLAGSHHVQADVGVPQHLPKEFVARPLVLPKEDTGKDYCAEFRRQMPTRAP